MPYRSRPPGRSAFSNTVTVCPARRNCCAAASPAGPEPTTATRLPEFSTGSTGRIHPFSQPRSAMSFSMALIVTGSSVIPSTQALSQGAGQRRPVNSGKLFVPCSAFRASRQRPLYARSLKSGTRFWTGQP